MTQTWLIFEADAQQSYINWHLVRNPGVCGYFLGCPPFLSGQAADEGWTFKPPHVWVQTIEEV
jgi:hypothetical protein